MAAPGPAFTDQSLLSRWMRDYRLSLALVVAGIFLVVATVAFSLWTDSTGNYSSSYWPGLVVRVGSTAGGMLMLLAGTVAYYHWRGLQIIEGAA